MKSEDCVQKFKWILMKIAWFFEKYRRDLEEIEWKNMTQNNLTADSKINCKAGLFPVYASAYGP